MANENKKRAVEKIFARSLWDEKQKRREAAEALLMLSRGGPSDFDQAVLTLNRAGTTITLRAHK